MKISFLYKISFLVLVSCLFISCDFYNNLYNPNKGSSDTSVENVDLTSTYVVRHMKQSLSKKGYFVEESEVIEGNAGDKTEAVAKDYYGFHAKPIIQQTISITCTTVIEIFYDRNTYTLSLELDGGDGIKSSYTDVFEQELNIPNPKRLGYIFAGWNTQNKKLPEILTEDGTFKALWTPASGIPYTINHYQEKLDTDDYELFEIEYGYGKTLSLTSATGKTDSRYSGFDCVDINQKEILPDGSTIVNVYYNRKRLNLTLQNVLDSGENYIVKLKYGQIIDIDTPKREGYLFLGWNPAISPSERIEADKTIKATWVSTEIKPVELINDEIKITKSNSGKVYTFTAPVNYSSYEWYVNSVVQSSTTNKCTVNFSSEPAGVYSVVVYARKNSVYYSATEIVKIE